jgi:hypothetical protein
VIEAVRPADAGERVCATGTMTRDLAVAGTSEARGSTIPAPSAFAELIQAIEREAEAEESA